MTALKELEFYQCGLTDSYASAICSLISTLPNLESLKLSDNKFTHIGMQPLTHCLRQANLRGCYTKNFHVGGNPLGTTGI